MSPLILTGMHRSGTSAVARLVQSMGFHVGSNLLAATENNRHGHFEEAGFIHFHDQLISRFFPDRAPFCEWLPLTDAETVHTDGDRADAQELWQGHLASGNSAWKDPRTSLFLDLWLNVLPEAKAIICLRHPYQVHLSLLRRGEPFLHVDYSAGIRGWTVYNERIRRVLAHYPADRVLAVDVEAEFRQPAPLAEKLARFLNVPLRSNAWESITPQDFHFENDLGPALENFAAYFPEAAALHHRLQQANFRPTDPGASAPAPAIRSEEARLIEFEEVNGLRKKARAMLIRSIAADRRRLTQLNRLSAEAHAEKDKLISDLSRFNEQLQQEVYRQRSGEAISDGELDGAAA